MLLKSNVAYLGVLLGLNQLFIILSSIIKTNTLILFAAAALIIGIVIVEFGTKSGIYFYLASCLLGFFLTFNKVEVISYILFFGFYSIIKHLAERKINNKNIALIIKLICFNISVLAIYIILSLISLNTIKLYWWLILGAEIIFFIYDYAFTIFINYYIYRIKPKIRGNQ